MLLEYFGLKALKETGEKEEYGLADVVSGRLVGETRVENLGT